jgi:hypothetical protein
MPHSRDASLPGSASYAAGLYKVETACNKVVEKIRYTTQPGGIIAMPVTVGSRFLKTHQM